MGMVLQMGNAILRVFNELNKNKWGKKLFIQFIKLEQKRTVGIYLEHHTSIFTFFNKESE